MTDSTNEKRPVRKLTVKNFSVIKEAELEFGKITVLIGPQASGKSLLCRLAFFFQQVVIEQAEEAVKASERIEELRQRLRDRFFVWFGASTFPVVTNWGSQPEITYSDSAYEIRVSGERLGDSGTQFRLEFSLGFERSYIDVHEKLEAEKQRRESLPNPKYFAEEIRERLTSLKASNSAEVYSYIPSNRSLFLSVHRAMFGTSQRLDDIDTRFARDFSYGFESRIPKAGLEHPLTEWINAESGRVLKGKVVSTDADPHFKTSDGRTLRLPVLSSGTQELLPLMTCLREYVAASVAVARSLDLPQALHRRLFFLEEPESNVFPATQYELTRIFARLSNEPQLDVYWVITTHSPYFLSSLNNLLEAPQVAASRPELKDEVAKLIPECFWIKRDDFRAYAIEDGVLKSIVAEDTGLVSTNYLDQVSETIGMEFDELLRLGYVES